MDFNSFVPSYKKKWIQTRKLKQCIHFYLYGSQNYEFHQLIQRVIILHAYCWYKSLTKMNIFFKRLEQAGLGVWISILWSQTTPNPHSKSLSSLYTVHATRKSSSLLEIIIYSFYIKYIQTLKFNCLEWN